MSDGAEALIFPPSDKRDVVKKRAARESLRSRAPIFYEAVLAVLKSTYMSALPDPGALGQQEAWFQATVDLLNRWGMLAGAVRGGV